MNKKKVATFYTFSFETVVVFVTAMGPITTHFSLPFQQAVDARLYSTDPLVADGLAKRTNYRRDSWRVYVI